MTKRTNKTENAPSGDPGDRLADVTQAMIENPPTIGELVRKLSSIRDRITAAGKKVDALKAERNAIELQLMGTLDHSGVKRISAGSHTATVTESVLPQVKDWDAFYRFILRNKAVHLLERRPLSSAFRETLELRNGRPIPGVESFIKRSISLRKNTD
jgi:hypothetical protein